MPPRSRGHHLSYDEVLEAADSSLSRLGTDYIDLYQIHSPNYRVPIEGAMEALVDMGKVRFIGVSNFSETDLQQAQAAMTRYEIASNQILYNLVRWDWQSNVVPYCQEQRITIIAYSPLAIGDPAFGSFFSRPRGVQVLKEVASEVGKTMAQVTLNWCIYHPNVIAIPKSDRVERVIENCDASGWRLSDEHIEALNNAFRGR